MNKYPIYAEVKGRKYKINTDFRYALECNKIALDDNIGDLERALAIIYILYGDKGLENVDDYNSLLNIAQKYLSCGKELKNKDEKPDMDFIEDYSYIKTSFRSDYGIKLDEEEIHWWEFMDLMNGLSNSEIGDCCILNRIRNLRNLDTKDIQDNKEKQKIEEAKREVELKCNKKKITEKEKESATKILEQIRIGKE